MKFLISEKSLLLDTYSVISVACMRVLVVHGFIARVKVCVMSVKHLISLNLAEGLSLTGSYRVRAL